MSSTQLQNRSSHVIERTRTSTKCEKMKTARAKRAKILFFIVKYANLWLSCLRRRRGCLKAHLHPRLIAIVCFCFESLYCPNAWSDWLNALKQFEKSAISSCTRQLVTTNFINIHRICSKYNTGKLKNVEQGTYLHRRIKIYVQDPIVMKNDDDNRS